MFTPMLRAFGQLDDPALLWVLLRSIALSALCFVGLAAGCVWLLHHWITAQGMLGWVATTFGGALATLAALWLFVPMAVVIAGLFLGPVCGAVERRWYPYLPPPSGAGFFSQNWAGLAIALKVAAFSLLSLMISIFVPVAGHLLGWLITAWALGRGLFASVAMRRMSRAEADLLYQRERVAVVLQGAALAALGVIPFANLLLPVVGPAAMVHLIVGGAGARSAGARARESWG